MSLQTMKPSKSGHLAALTLIIVSVGVWIISASFPDMDKGYPGPSLFPRIIATGLFVIGIWDVIGVIYKKETFVTNHDSKDRRDYPMRLLTGIILIAIFPLTSPILGFLPSLFMLTIGMGILLQISWHKTLVIGVLTVAFIYVIFSQLLNVTL